jgi:VanZ family protein
VEGRVTQDGAVRGEVVRAWLAVALWTALVWTLSSDAFSAGETSRVLEPLLRLVFPGLDAAGIERIHFAVRKAAHATEYGVLALLVLRALRVGARQVARPLRWSAVLALAFAASVATADELRQAQSEARTGSPKDVALDAAGAAAALAGALAVRRFTRARRPVTGTASTDAGEERAHVEDV